MNEFDIIERYFRFPPRRPGVELAGGDDAAIMAPAPGERLVVTTDILAAGRHFPADGDPAAIAARCLRCNISDLVAMGAQPRWFTLAISLPAADADWLAAFSRGLAAECEHWQIDLIGGDTTKGELSIAIQMLGTLGPDDSYLARSGARPGDVVLVTGSLGDAVAWLDLKDEAGLEAEALDYLYRRFWYPQPPLAFVISASSLISAACDISDGLAADLGHICKSSGVGARINAAELPLSAVLQGRDEGALRRWALAGGDDYEICLTAAPEDVDRLTELAAKSGTRLTQVGEIVPGSAVSCYDAAGKPLTLPQSGYRHF